MSAVSRQLGRTFDTATFAGRARILAVFGLYVALLTVGTILWGVGVLVCGTLVPIVGAGACAILSFVGYGIYRWLVTGEWDDLYDI